MEEILVIIGRQKGVLKGLEEQDNVEYEMAVILGYIGVAYFKIENYELSQKNCEKQLSVAQDIGDRKLQGTAYTNLGCIHSRTGNLNEAMECFEKSLLLARDRGDMKGISRNLNNLGNIHQLRSNLSAAVECHEERLEISRQINDLDGICKACSCLGGLHRANGQLEISIKRYEDLLDTLRTKLKIQLVLADDESDSDDEVDVDEIAYDVMRERMDELGHHENGIPMKTPLLGKIKKSCVNMGALIRRLVKR